MRKRELVRQRDEALKLANEVVAETAGQVALVTEVQRETIGLAREAVAVASASTTMASTLVDRLKNASPGEALTADELQAFAEAAPLWTISSGIRSGRAYKEYRRIIEADEITPERQPGGPLERETYLSLADSENSDRDLANIFDTFYVDGDYMNGKSYIIRFHANEATPVTYGDFVRVLNAEAYLVDAGYISEQQTVTAEV